MISSNQNISAQNNPVVTRSNSSGNNPTQKKPHTYRVIKLIGEGAFGKAYLVECNSDKSNCVIKTINIDKMSDQEKKETLLEAKILEKLDHPNIIGFKEVFLAKRPVFTINIVTEYADGGDLSTKIKSQKGRHFSENQILDWFTQICLALKHIHDKKILHRDLKSQNIFLTENGMVKLGDFGIAKCLEYTWQKAMTVVGTPYYLSPEIVNNKPYSFKSDIWSLGVLLYEISALKMPFDASSLPMLSLKIIKGQFIPLPSNLFSKDLRTLISLLLVVDQAKRPSINEILKLPIIKSRINSFLSEVEYNQEFSHTIIHNFNVLKDKNVVVKRNNSSSIETTQIQSNQDQEEVISKIEKKPSPSPSKEPLIMNNIKRNDLVIHCKPQIVESKKRELDNKEISEFMKKNDRKKNPTPSKDVRRPSNSKLSKNVESTNQINIKVEKQVEKQVVSCQAGENKDKLLDTQFITNPLQVLMRRAKADNKIDQKVVILEKEKPIHKESHLIDVNGVKNSHQHAVINNKNKNKKEEEEIYNLNRYLNELAKLEHEPEGEEDETHDTNLQNNNIHLNNNDIHLNEARDEIVVEETEESNTVKEVSENIVEVNNPSENNQIEELRIELENSLGFEVFRKVYKTVEEKTDPLLIKCDFELLKDLIITELSGEYDNKKIESAIEKIPEVFAIVVNERITNIK